MVVLLAGYATPASAEFWGPLDTVPKPNFVVGLDSSVTMGIRSDCSSCHSPGNPNTRLNEAKQDILATLPMFQDYFVFGGYEYSGCQFAKVERRFMPRPDNPTVSYNQVRGMVSAATHCGSRENYLPGGGPPTGCITPSPMCAADPPIFDAILNGGALPGFTPTAPAIADPTVDVTCDTPSPPNPTYNLAASVISKLGAGAFGWPRWDPVSLHASFVLNDLCTPLGNVLGQIRAELAGCLVDPTTVWDLSFLDGGFGTWCNPGQIALNACVGGSVLDGTCVCDSTQPGCVSGSLVNSECNKLMIMKARQQVAVCETYSTAQPNRFGSFYLSQSDNIANGMCRENVSVFLTDGYVGNNPTVAAEAADALNFYRSADGLSNMFVFRVSNEFAGHANRMMQVVSGGQINTAYNATDRATMQEAFAKVLSRIYKGVYTGANMGTDTYQTRAVFHSFTVPGYSATGPVSDDYLGFPSRISVHEIQTDGTINPVPRFESDWRDRVTAAPTCGPFTIGGTHTARLGPGGTFRNGVARNVDIPPGSTDRDGDGVTDSHPTLRYGRSYGFATGAAIVVDAPREANPGADAGEVSDYLTFITDPAILERPRVYYYSDGGYVIGIHGGTYESGTFNYGNQGLTHRYNDAAAPAGAEVFRFRPTGLNDSNATYTYNSNDLIQQPLITGDLVAKEVRVRVSGTDMFRTVLVGNQGKEGRNYFAVDVSNPCSPPAFDRTIRLDPGDYASAKPAVYTVPMTSAPQRRSALITTGGLNGSARIFSYDLVSGARLATRALPAQAGASYATAPVCVDVTGEGVVTHCYALRTDGFLARVEVRPNGFGPVQDVTPVNAGGTQVTMTGGKQYFTSPVAYFGVNGEVNLVFGSGDYRNLTSAPVANSIFKVVDPATRQAGVPGGATQTDQVCVPTSGGSTDGEIPLGPGERLLSQPVVNNGVVAFSTYISSTSGCISGSGVLYAMDFETCEDVINPSPTNTRPAGTPVGDGIPTQPVLHQQSQTLLVQTSAGPTGAQTQTQNAQTRFSGRPPVKRLYWRLESANP